MNGLTSKEAALRLKRYGLNELKKEKAFSSRRLLFNQFKSPLIYILVIAALITFLLKDLSDTLIILLAVLLNTALGFYQERKAQKTLTALKDLLTPRAKVVRDGKQMVVDVSQIVPGDLVVLAVGDRVPADGVLVEAKDLLIEEAILTGESLPAEKFEAEPQNLKSNSHSERNLVFAGTTVVGGNGNLLVTKTGMQTRMGKIGQLVEEINEEKTPLQIQLNRLAQILAGVVTISAALIFILGEIRGYGHLEIFTTSVAVAVAAIPEGLVVTLTVILALGMQRISEKKAIVRKLLAAETLGLVSVICVDKTGTLTEGKLKVVEDEFTNQELGVKAAILCNDMRDPLALAMKDWAEEKMVADSELIKEEYPRLDEIPFGSSYKYFATLHRVKNNQKSLLLVAGAPEVVLGKCRIEDKTGDGWRQKLEEYGGKGYRLVGFAYKEVDAGYLAINHDDISNLNWLGVLVYEDPIRSGVKEALAECRQAGIKVKVITGDYLPTALAVMEKLGLDGRPHCLTGEELEKLTPNELRAEINRIALFARTNPEQKLKIVQVLKDNGEVVAMMGDGVNDAPALAYSDIGIVVGEASDVARETADMVLLDSNFATIVRAVKEGRVIFENVKKVVLYLLSSSFTELILIGGSLLMRIPLPVTAAQILWINLIEDTLPGMALAFEKEDQELMNRLPRPKNAPILDAELKALIFIIGLLTDLILLFLYLWLRRGFLHLHFINTVMFAALVIDSLFYVFACRRLRKPIFHYNPFGNKALNFSIICGFLALILAIYNPFLQRLLRTQPLGLSEWMLLFGLGLFDLTLIEITKWIFIARKKT